ncbi:FecR domain-containing protein [Pseudoxanthomonas japonensis]|nr:FecR domain-containing protein [Pseudoxanthomonas japonensis]
MNSRTPPTTWAMDFAADSADEAAARWSEILRDAPDQPRLREGFDAWHARSPENAAAWRRIQAANHWVRTLSDSPEMQSLRRETLARVAEGRLRSSRRWRRLSIAASLLLLTGVGLIALRPEATRGLFSGAGDTLAGNVYQTGVGQRSVVTMDDGSVVTLNTDSRLSVHYRADVRAVTLERGQALFKVAKDRSRPFVVTADGKRVTALGTEFDVRVGERLFEVTLLEGRVGVAPAQGVAPSPANAATLAELHPGQQFVATDGSRPVVRVADVGRVVSWRTGQIVFDNERLDAAIAEVNRYSRRKVVLGDPQLASLKISGAFNAGDTHTFVEALTNYFPIQRDPREDERVVLESRSR